MKLFSTSITFVVGALLLPSITLAATSFKDQLFSAGPVSECGWNGYYGGFNVGVVEQTMNVTDTNATTFQGTIQQDSDLKPSIGLQIGYRRQLDMSKMTGVYGAELSTNFSNTQFNKQYGSPTSTYQLNSKNSLYNVSLLELTGGITAEKTLLFIAAGLSWVDISGTTTNQSGVPFFNSFNVGKNQFGSALGGGIEYAYNNKISVRFKVDVVNPSNYSTTDNVGDSFELSNRIVQGTLGLNYKFDTIFA